MSTMGAQAVGSVGARRQRRSTPMPKLLLRNAGAHARAARPCATRTSASGRPGPGRSCATRCALFAIGLRKLGLERGDTVAIIGDNRPRLYATFAAVQSLGGIAVPVYQDSVADEMAYVLEHAEVKFAIVQDQEQVDKVISIADRLPKLEHDHLRRGARARRLRSGQPAFLRARAGARAARSCSANAGAAGWWLDEIAKGKGADVSVMLYTSGTTGRPKGVMLTHDNIVVSAENGNKFDDFTPTTSLLAYLPMAWVGDHIFSYGQAYAARHVRVPARRARRPSSRTGARSARPTSSPRRACSRTCSPRSWCAWRTRAGSRSGMFHYFLGVARRCGEQILDGKPVGASRIACSTGWAICSSTRRCATAWASRSTRVAYTAGEAIGPELFQLLPLARHQPEAALRPDRGQRLHHAAARRRGLSRHRRQAGTRTSRSRSPTAARCCSRARACSSSTTRTTRRPAPPRRRTAGCTRAMPASSTSAGT